MNRKKLNQKFLDLYEQFDKICCEKFGISTGGATEYLNRLNNARFAPGRDDVLPRLVGYRNLRNSFASDPAKLKKADDLTKDDCTWLQNFVRDVKKQKDPISVYLKKARSYARRRKAGKVAIVVGIIAVVAAVVAAVVLL